MNTPKSNAEKFGAMILFLALNYGIFGFALFEVLKYFGFHVPFVICVCICYVVKTIRG